MEEYLFKNILAYITSASHIKRRCHLKISSSSNLLPITEN